ncbi:MAG: mechanosensitive ion channel [Chlamydiia bacterium]|nr:mechanosensitive ion channel [Chlamydiia bacterium]
MEFLKQFVTTQLICTVIIVLLLWSSKFFIARYIRRANRDWSSQQRLRWINSIRILVFVLTLLSVIFLWGEKIQGFAVSVFAITYAMVFSVKELCMSLNGFIVRYRGKFFEIGDRIEIGNIRGDVIDATLLSTTVQELGSKGLSHLYTGKKITFSNSLFLTLPVVNESFLEKYYMIRLEIPIDPKSCWKTGKGLLLQIAEEEIAPYLEQARLRLLHMEKKMGIQLPFVEPIVTLSIPEPSQVALHLRMLSPTGMKAQLEQKVIARFLESFYQSPSLESALPEP